MTGTKRAPCPHCGKKASLDEGNPWRPFCCERCKLIDLGDWVAGKHTIPAEDQAPVLPPDEEPRQ